MTYKVSVIIPTYNVEKFIKNSIDSLMNQTIGFENIELIMVDNSSTDSTKDILDEYSKYPNIKCFYPEGNTGTPSRGRNIGIENASSDYVMFLDADDRYVKNMCEVLYDTIVKTKKNVVMCRYKIIEDNNFDIFDENQDTSFKIHSTEDDVIFYDVPMWNKIYNKEFLKKYDIKCPYGLLIEDIYFCVQCFLNTSEIVLLNNFYGYLYNVRDSENDSSLCHNVDTNYFMITYKTYFGICKFFIDAGRQDLLNKLMKREFCNVIGCFCRLNENKEFKLFCLNEIYDLIEYSNFDENLNEKWADVIFKNIKKRNFNVALTLSKIVNTLYRSNFIRKIYKKI